MEMFADNTAEDDIAMLENFLSQIRDNVNIDILPISAYDKTTKTDYGIGDIIRYLQRKYPTAIYGKELDNQETF